MRKFAVGLAIGFAFSLGTVFAQQSQYQVSLWFLAKSNALEAYYYQDDIMRCTVFMASGNGITPVCFDRRPVNER